MFTVSFVIKERKMMGKINLEWASRITSSIFSFFSTLMQVETKTTVGKINFRMWIAMTLLVIIMAVFSGIKAVILAVHGQNIPLENSIFDFGFPIVATLIGCFFIVKICQLSKFDL